MSGFLGQALFGKNGKVRIFWTSPVWKKPLIKVKKFKKCDSAPKIFKSSLSPKPYVRIFRTSPVWQKRKSPDFLESGF